MDYKAQNSIKPSKFEIYELKVSLKDITPAIWRRLLVSGDQTLSDLHMTIQYAMGWLNHYLYAFECKNKVYQSPGVFTQNGHSHFSRETSLQLSDLKLQQNESFLYIYEWGERWVHEVCIEAIQTTSKPLKYPYCLDGKRACPPEECGGIEGYKKILQTLQNKDSADFYDLSEWLPKDFDSEMFDIELANQLLFDHFKNTFKKEIVH